jgi:hypothetical protein
MEELLILKKLSCATKCVQSKYCVRNVIRLLFSSVNTALGYGLDDRGSRVRFPAGAVNFSLHHRVQKGSGVHPASYPMGTGTLSLGVKRPGSEADHSPPSSAEVKTAWSYTSTSPIRLHGVVLS